MSQTSAVEAHIEATTDATTSTGLVLLNTIREAISDMDERVEVSAPGVSEPGEIYVEIRGQNFLVRVEVL